MFDKFFLGHPETMNTEGVQQTGFADFSCHTEVIYPEAQMAPPSFKQVFLSELF